MLAVAQEGPVDPCRLRRIEALSQLREKLLPPTLLDQLATDVARADDRQVPHLTRAGQVRRKVGAAARSAAVSSRSSVI